VIDWVSFSLPYDGPPVGVQYLKRETWDAPIEPAFSKPVKLEGSYSSSLTAHAIGGRLYISGNPVKWLTGQNVLGTNNLRLLITETLDRVIDRLRLFECPRMLQALRDGNVNLTRVDCTFSYRVGSNSDVVLWLEAMEHACHVRFRGRGHYSQAMCCLTYGMTMKEGAAPTASRRSIFKFYNKWQEMGEHPPTCDHVLGEQLREKVWGTVRGEACYRGIELKRLGKERLSAWNACTALELHRDWVEKMEMAETYELKHQEQQNLPRRLQATYRLWKNGETMKELLSKSTFYEHRRHLLEHGIDIANSCPAPDKNWKGRVIPIIRVLEAKPIAEERDEELFWKLVAAAA